jgi:beta-mannosidase
MTNRRALESLVSPEHRWPADRTNPVYEHLGAFWNNAPLVQAAFGERLHEVEAMRRASQWLQYEGLRYAVEATIRRGAGVVPWQFNESFPNAWCTSALDHRGDPKPAYWGVARAYRSGHASASFETSAWGGHTEARALVEGAAQFVDLDGTVVAATEGGALVVPLEAFSSDVFLLTLPGNRYVMTRTVDLSPLLDLAPAEVTAELDGDVLRLRHVAGPAALGIVVEDARPLADDGWVVLEDNVLDLLPGESRALRVEGTRAPLLVEGWNVVAQRVG